MNARITGKGHRIQREDSVADVRNSADGPAHGKRWQARLPSVQEFGAVIPVARQNLQRLSARDRAVGRARSQDSLWEAQGKDEDKDGRDAEDDASVGSRRRSIDRCRKLLHGLAAFIATGQSFITQRIPDLTSSPPTQPRLGESHASPVSERVFDARWRSRSSRSFPGRIFSSRQILIRKFVLPVAYVSPSLLRASS